MANVPVMNVQGNDYDIRDQQAQLQFGYLFVSNTYIRTDGTTRTGASGRSATGYIPCSPGVTVKYVAETNNENLCGIAFYDIEKHFIRGYSNNGTIGTEVTVTSPAKTAYCRISTNAATLASSYVKIQSGEMSTDFDKLCQKTVYISPNGHDDDGDGSLSNPYETANKALSEGAAKIMVMAGTYAQIIDLSKACHNHITIASNNPTGRAVFIHPDSFVTSSETKVSGRTKVYSCNYSQTFYAGIRLYQEDVPDVTTLITDAERNPYERGQAYRCLDTKIEECTSTSLNNALTEIDESDTYKYFRDTVNGKIYFSRPQTVSASHPIMRSCHPAVFFANQPRSMQLSIYGIECKYMRFNVSGTVAHLEDCKATSTFGAGGFVYDQCLSTEFVRCEACGTYYAGGAGDGFNGHSSSTGEIYSKQTTVRLVDCWSHDCQDDGYSDHERSEIEIWGGLFEYNGKAGVTPSYGSHCSCYNVISRRNYSGFLYLGEATQAEGGKYGQMLCIMCVAENNNDPASGYGFAVFSDGNLARMINCKSIGNNIGYVCSQNTIMELTDCGSVDDGSIKSDNGTLYVKNTALVTVE